METYQKTDWLPVTRKEMELRGWEQADIVLFSGDAYVDHPSFGTAVAGRLLEAYGMKVAIVPQPDWRGDFRDFTKMGKPRYFFAISAGCMDSMVNRYTANKRLRSDDAYTAGGLSGARPDYTSITYANILKKLYPDVPIVLGGIEASMRRLSHYDYWSDRLMPGILVDSKADLLVYGMGEKPLKEIAALLLSGAPFEALHELRQVAYLRPATNEKDKGNAAYIKLHAHETCLNSKRKQAENFRIIEEESNKMEASVLIQPVGRMEIVVNPPHPPLSSEELDKSFELPYTRLPHPKYKDKTIPAYEMIKFSVNLHRGCFGGCAFCAIAAHQGKFVVSRSKESVLKEVTLLSKRNDFKGYLSDLGGPSANMYRMQGKDLDICRKCKRYSCIFPKICSNLNVDHRPLLDIYRSVDALPGIKKSVVSSGIRYDLLLYSSQEALSAKSDQNAIKEAADKDRASREYTQQLIGNHVSGRLKVAPEHTENSVLLCMRKPAFSQFIQFKEIFEQIENRRLPEQQRNQNFRLNEAQKKENREGKARGRQELIPYFISSHPACGEEDMAELAAKTKTLNFRLEQVQDFTPTPMTPATEMYYTGLDPYTLKPVYTAKTKEEKLAQRQYFFWYRPEDKAFILKALHRLKRADLIEKIYGKKPGKV
ncbi:MAG: YgiQ family radical SAM protein [Bacteroidales bacterium]|nr:YgiQ family radical SAM protein [Bacteroidales bacterium]